MTDTRKPRWDAAQRRKAKGGVEQRGRLAGSREVRLFKTAVSTGHVRAAAAATGNGFTITGRPCVYSTPYTVHDSFGTFSETVEAGAVRAILPTADVRFLFDHGGLPLARTTSGTLTLTDTPQALTFSATVDQRQSLANDLAIAIQRGDCSQMSIGFMVGSDQWNADYTQRTIFTFADLLDVSAVTYPASPTTSIEVLDLPEPLDDVGGPDGTQDGNGPESGVGNQDGSGSRARQLEIELDLLRLRRRPVRF